MSFVSCFELFRIGIGPSSSHTVGPMRAALHFIDLLREQKLFTQVSAIRVELYGSLGLTGIGHGSDRAVILGLLGETPETVVPDQVPALLQQVERSGQLMLAGCQLIAFPAGAILLHRDKSLSLHPNGMSLHAQIGENEVLRQTYFSIGGGFVVTEQQLQQPSQHTGPAVPYPFSSAADLLRLCRQHNQSIAQLMWANEQVLRSRQALTEQLQAIWQAMQSCMQRGLSQHGDLPGGLQLKRRAAALQQRLLAEASIDPMRCMDWVNAFAMAVNEENAAGGRVVTAPTNGAAGVLPAVMAYYHQFVQPFRQDTLAQFLLTAAAIGGLFKQNASISGAEVGCQGEVGVACSMAAAGLTAVLGGTVAQVEMAAEIGMEHHLGLTCDPVAGLVQVPCIERNAMGAMKAINASRMALRNQHPALVSLDKVIAAMKATGRDMHHHYKETSLGGLAVAVSYC